jgi:hypothetical protein
VGSQDSGGDESSSTDGNHQIGLELLDLLGCLLAQLVHVVVRDVLLVGGDLDVAHGVWCVMCGVVVWNWCSRGREKSDWKKM